MPAAGLPELAFAGGPLEPGKVAAARQEEPGHNKPAGGLWLSPARRNASGRVTGTAWTEYCRRAGYRPAAARGARVTVVPLAPTARVAVITGPSDYAALTAAAGTRPGRGGPMSPPEELDWDRAAELADAIWLTSDGNAAMGGWGEPFYWWDTETVVVLNPAAVRY